MYKLYGISLVVLVFLAGCNNDEPQAQVEQDSMVVFSEMTTTDESTEEAGGDFPIGALAVRPDSESERRDSGNSEEGKIYYLSIVVNEEIGRCFTRRVEVKGTFYQTTSENWSIGQVSLWDSERTEVTVEIQEDTSMCRGGQFLVFRGSVQTDGLSFEVDETALSVRFYADVPVYFTGANIVKNVSIAIDGIQIAKGDLVGGSISTSNNVEWSEDFDFESENSFEAVNVTFDGSISVDNYAVVGYTNSRLSRSVFIHDANGTRPIDSFVRQISVGGKG